MNPLLSADQALHITRVREIIRTHHFWREISGKGLGKTRTTTAVGLLEGLELFVVCPANLTSIWEEEIRVQHATRREVMSYETLRYNLTKNHPYLEWDLATGAYTPKSEFKAAIRVRPILLVFDEVQYLKRDTTHNLRACHALSIAVAEVNETATKPSKIALISASPYEANEFAINTARAAGIVRSQLYSGPEALLAGYRELKEYCLKIDPKQVDDVHRQFTIRGSTRLEDLVAELIRVVLGPAVNASMQPIQSEFEHTFENKFFQLSEPDRVRVENAVQNRRRYIGSIRMGTVKGSLEGAEKNYFEEVEPAKLSVMVDDVLKTLASEPTSKAIVFLWSLASFKTLTERFNATGYRVLIYNGSIKPAKRPEIRAKFQQPDGEYRIILINPKVGGFGTSFDDTHGGYPRRVWVIPNDHFQTLFQAEDRHVRRTTRSDTRFTVVYAAGIPYEEQVRARLEQKRGRVAESIGHAYPIRDIETVHPEQE